MILKLGKNKLFFKNYFKKIVIFGLIASWIFFGFPQIFNFPPKIQEAKAATTILRPNETGFYQQWGSSGSTHWGVTSDKSDSSYIEDAGTNNLIDIQALQDPTFDVSSTINSVTIYARVYASGSGGAEKISFFDRLGTTDRAGVSFTVARDSFHDYNSDALSTDPTGLAWTKTSISDLQVGVKAAAIGTSEILRTSEIWIVVDYTPPPNQPPATPTNISPANGTPNQSLTPTLSASAYSDPDNDPQSASQWQITTTSGNYSSPVFDSGENATNLTSIAVPASVLAWDTTYYWHVRYKDNQGNWSNYSSETSFSTASGKVMVYIEKGGGEEYNSGETASLMVQVKDVSGLPLNSASVTLNIYDPSKSKVINGQAMTYITSSNGLYYYDYVVPSTVGIYIFDIKATNASREGYIAGTFHVSPLADTVAQKVWSYSGRSLDNISNISQGVWEYSVRTLTSFGTLVSDIWSYSDRTLTSFGTLVSDIWSYSGRSLDNISNITQGVWEYSNRTLTSFGTLVSDIWSNTTRTLTSGTSIAQDIWNATTRKLTSREITVGEYITGESSSEMPTQYNIELVRKATFDFAGIADGGSTTTLIDAELDQPDDHWVDYELWMMSGNNIGLKRAICDFNKESHTITLCVGDPLSQPIASGDQYVISHERKLVHAIWNWSERTLTSAANIAGDIWSYTGGRTLTSIGSLAVDIWNDTFAPTRRLTEKTLTGGGNLATEAYLDTMKSNLITEINENQTLIQNLNNISAADVWSYSSRGLTEEVELTPTSTKAIWDVAKAELTTTGSIGKQIADNLDVAISTRSTLTATDVWNAATRTLTDYATSSISLAVWSEATRELTNYGNDITAQDVWNVLSSTLTLQDSIGKQLAGNVDVAVSTRASQASIDALNNISATDVWSYANRSITDPDAIWEYALTQIGNTGSIGKLLKDNIDAAISSRGTSNLTAADVWNSVTRTLTSNANFNDPDSATIAAAVWSEATRELTSYGNDITAQDIWNILSANLTTDGTIGKQLAANVDAAISTRSTLTAANVWEYTNRTLTNFGTLVADIWSYSTRSLTTFGTLAADVWNNSTRTLTSALLGGGGQIATTADLDAMKTNLITEINENQTLISALNNISATDVWSYANRNLTGAVDLTSTSTKAIWDVAKSQLTTAGSIGKQIADNLDAAVSTRSTLTATDVWNAATRTLTDYATSSISLAVWSEATRELTNYGNNITAADVWNVLSSTLTLQDSIGKQLAGNVDVAVSTRASQASLDALNNIAAADVWSYANRSITDPDAIWEYALTQIGNTGSIGTLLKDNINATISSRGTSNLTAADVWNSVTRTLTSNANFNDPDSATIAVAVWSEATRELTNYGNDITAQDIWNILSANLTTNGSIGKQLAANVDVAVSTRSTLTAAGVWGYTNRTLTDFGTLVADIWNYSTRSLTTFGTLVADIWSNPTRTLSAFGSLAADIWNNTFAPTRRLTDQTLTGGGSLATQADVTAAKNEIIALINGLNNISAADVWAYSNRSLTDPDSIWEYALTQIGNSGSIGLLLKNNIDATISSRGTSTLTANDVWNAAVRTLTANTNLGISTPAQIADAIWDEAIADHVAAGSTGKALTTASTGGAGAGGLKIETHTVSEFEQGDTAAAAVVQVLNNGVPVSGVTPVGTFYKPDNSVWAGHENVNFTEIPSTGIYTYNFDTTGATLGVYKLAVSAAQSTGGSNFQDSFGTAGNCGTTNWQNTGATYVVAEESSPHYCIYKKTDWGGYHYAFAPSTSGLSDFTYSADVRLDDYLQYGGLAFRYANSGNNYVFQFRPGEIRLTKWVNSGASTLASTAFSTALATWYNVSIVVTGGHIVISVDGVEKINFTDLSPLPAGMVALYTYNQTASWDNIVVTAAGTSQYAYIAKDFAIVTPKATQASINALNNISAADVWSYATRGLTESVNLTNPKQVWDVAKAELTTAGSIGKQVADNLDVAVSTRSTLTAADVWNAATRTLTDYATSSIATAVWQSATRELTNYGNDITAQDVWNVLITNLTTVGSIGKAFADNRVVQFVQDGEVLAGSGTNNYRAKLYIYNLETQLVNAAATPTITIYNASRAAFVTDALMDDLDPPATGTYEYVTTIGAGQGPGRWEAVVTINTGGTNPIKTSGYFEVEASPAQVKINSISDNTVPSISANVTITNEGAGGYEYQYEYCVVDTIGNQCGGGDDVAYSVGAKYLLAGQSWTTDLGLTVANIGTYWYKVYVYWGTEKSVAVRQFDAVGEEVPPPTPGVGAAPPPPPPVVCMGADFNKDGIVNSIDFSILLYFWKTQPPFRNPCVDINKDGRVDSIDFSILLYQWGKPGVNIK